MAQSVSARQVAAWRKKNPKQCAIIRERAHAKQCANRDSIVSYLGGQCATCGYDKHNAAIDLHHVTNKDFPVNRKHCSILERAMTEAIKTVPLCKICHTEVHIGVRELPKSVIDEVYERYGTWCMTS